MARRLIDDPEEAARRGAIAREAALERYGLDRFLTDWDELLADVAHRPRSPQGPRGGIADTQSPVEETP